MGTFPSIAVDKVQQVPKKSDVIFQQRLLDKPCLAWRVQQSQLGRGF